MAAEAEARHVVSEKQDAVREADKGLRDMQSQLDSSSNSQQKGEPTQLSQ